MSRDSFVDHLQGILNETRSGAYIGGSLDLGNAWLNTDGIANWGSGQRKLNKEEHLLVCKIYLKYKTPNHAFYQQCKDFVSRD